MYQLRDYQKYAVSKGISNLTQKEKPFILQLATGAGKSIIIAAIAKELDGPVLVLQPSKELLLQNYSKFVSYKTEVESGMYSASVGKRDIKQITYATIQSIFRRPDEFKHFKYVIIDECHQVNPKNLTGMYGKFLKDIGCTRICGLTATPYRLENRFFSEDGQKFYSAELKMINRIFPFFFKNIECKIETAQLIAEGYLSPILYRNVDMGDMSGLRVNNTGSEYTADSIKQYWQNDMRLMKLCQIIEKIDAKCQRNLIFCSSLLQAKRAREMLREMGIRAEMVDGTTPAKERDRLVAEYRRGEFKHMLNVGVFTTGFDVPELDCVVLARPTISLALYYQMVGRGVRLDPARPDKKLRVYDLVKIVEKLGRVETIAVKKEEGGWKDVVISEVGEMTNVPLFKFAVNAK